MRTLMVLSWMLCGCGTVIGAESAGSPIPAAFHEVPAYPGAHHLCSQNIVLAPSGEIVMQAYASPDPIARVRAFYEEHHGSATFEEDGASFSLRMPDPDQLVAFHPDAAGSPTCGVLPGPADQTYIVVSTFHRWDPPPTPASSPASSPTAAP